MRCKRIGAGAALAAGVLAVSGLAFAPAALAVTPQAATISADCGTFGSGEATLTATQNGTAATVTVKSSAITAPIALGADSISSSLTLVKSGGGTVAFTGTKNPAMAAGAPSRSAPSAAPWPPATAWRPSAAR